MISNILVIGGLGSLLFTCFILLMSVTGIAGEMRDEEGNFRKRLNWKILVGGVAFISFLLGLLFIGNINYAGNIPEVPTFFQFWLNSLGIFMVVHIYDLIVLDYLIVVRWRPKFLNLPDTHYYTSITPHLKGFFKGIPIGILASLIASLISVSVS